MQSSERYVFRASQLRSDSACHIPRTTCFTSASVDASCCSTDIGEFAFRGGGGRRLPGAQEAAGAFIAECRGGFTVAEHGATGDEYRGDGVVVAVDHAGQPAVLLNLLFGVIIKRR